MFADRRATGAIAGLGPAAVILGYYLLTGGPVQPGLLTIVAAATAAGWLTEPRVGHGTRQDALAAVAYLLVGYLLERVMGVAITSWRSVSGVAGDPPSVLEVIGTYGLVTILYLPLWAIVLSPLAMLWVLTVRAFRGRFGRRPAGASISRTRPRPPAQPGNLLWPPVAAVIAYVAGFSLVTPWGCTATSTVGADGSLTTGTMTVCSSLIGATYSGQGIYDPPREPAIQAGLVLAAIVFVIVLLAVLWMRRDGRVGASG
jgi:hypothetical protein